MDLEPIITRLRDQVTELRAVDGAAGLAAAREAPTITPAAWVIPVADSAVDNELITGHSQRVTARFGVVLCVTAHARSAAGSRDLEILHPLREALATALIAWVPAAGLDPIEFVAGRLIGLADARLWWQDEFHTRFYRRVT